MSRGEVELVDPAREDSRARETPRGGDDVETAGEMEASTSPVGERLAGFNDDGYFGDEDGTWLPNDRVPLVLRQQREEIRATTDVRGDWVELFERFGWLIAASAFCVLLLVFALDKFSGANNKHKP